MSYKLLLFDVDLTLVNTAGAGRRAMTRAFEDMFEEPNGFHQVSFAGSTDGAIIREAMKHIGVSWNEDLEAGFKKRYFTYLATTLQKPNEERHIEPGIQEILVELAAREDVVLALLTGNWREGAKLKLTYFNLWRFFEFGAFSDDAWVRSDLPGIAARKLAKLKDIHVKATDVYVIGDTPRDVECARPFGANSVAVATGFYSFEQLKSAKPDYLFDNFADASDFLAILDA